MIQIQLTTPEILLAGNVGLMRAVQNFSRGTKERYGATGNLLQRDIIGAIGELALAKHLNVYWAGSVGNWKARDVAGFQVRASDLYSPSLILHDEDKDTDIFVCVGIDGTMATILGAIQGLEGKLPKWWRSDLDRPAYFVRQLRAFEEFR
jgi:hypothetical protein